MTETNRHIAGKITLPQPYTFGPVFITIFEMRNISFYWAGKGLYRIVIHAYKSLPCSRHHLESFKLEFFELRPQKKYT